MFGKEKEKLQSFLGTQSELQGDVIVKGILRLDGVINGKIRADEVILSATAFMRGEIAARKIVVGGTVEGCLRATELLEIGSKGRVKGEIVANKLIIIEGGECNGQIEMRVDKSNIIDFKKENQAL